MKKLFLASGFLRLNMVSILFLLFLLGAGNNKKDPSLSDRKEAPGWDGNRFNIADGGLVGWTRNPGLDKSSGLWRVRTFCWAIGADCPDDLELSEARWDEDGIFLKARDDHTRDLGCDCAAMTQGTGFDGSVRGAPLERIRTGDIEAAYILLQRSDVGATGCLGIVGAGNIINLWLRRPDGSIWVTDVYFETKGLNSGYKERAAPHNKFVTLFSPLPWERGNDWYAYQIILEEFPEYWSRETMSDGSTSWVIDLYAILMRGSEFSGRDLSDYLWYYVEVVSEDVCIGGKAGESEAGQKIQRFEIKVKLDE